MHPSIPRPSSMSQLPSRYLATKSVTRSTMLSKLVIFTISLYITSVIEIDKNVVGMLLVV